MIILGSSCSCLSTRDSRIGLLGPELDGSEVVGLCDGRHELIQVGPQASWARDGHPGLVDSRWSTRVGRLKRVNPWWSTQVGLLGFVNLIGPLGVIS